MLRLRDGGTQSVWGTKVFYVLAIVCHRMLPRQRKTCWSGVSDAYALKDLPVVVETLEGVVELIQCCLGKQTSPCKVAEVEVGAEAPDYVSRNETLYCRHPNLAPGTVELSRHRNGRNANLHECFGVVSSPLLKVAPLLETTESREWRCQCDAVVVHDEHLSPKHYFGLPSINLIQD